MNHTKNKRCSIIREYLQNLISVFLFSNFKLVDDARRTVHSAIFREFSQKVVLWVSNFNLSESLLIAHRQISMPLSTSIFKNWFLVFPFRKKDFQPCGWWPGGQSCDLYVVCQLENWKEKTGNQFLQILANDGMAVILRVIHMPSASIKFEKKTEINFCKYSRMMKRR